MNQDSKTAQVYGSFFLGSSEFCIDVKKVREVVNLPVQLTEIPHAANHLRGAFNLRGAMIPVLDLRRLFATPENENRDAAEPAKVAIIEYGKLCLGLLFDQTGEVFRSHKDDRAELSSIGQSLLSKIVNGCFKRDKGERIVMILDIESLMRLENIPFEESDHSAAEAARLLRLKKGHRKQCISFGVGHSHCALPISAIQEILKIDKVSDSVLEIYDCVGSIELRGSIVPLIDFSAFLGFREKPQKSEKASENQRVIVMKLPAGLFGLVVDSVEDIVPYFNDDLIKVPVVANKESDLIVGCISRENHENILLLDENKILDDAKIHEISEGHSRLYQREKQGETSIQQAKKSLSRKTLISFTLESRYAVAIDQVREIIEINSELLHPPGLPTYVKGVLNLRGDLLTIIDTRAMYALASQEVDLCKVLILKTAGAKYGIVVDSVDEIITFDENEKVRLPELTYKERLGEVADDVIEAIQVSTSEAKNNFLILNPEAICRRIESGKNAA